MWEYIFYVCNARMHIGLYVYNYICADDACYGWAEVSVIYTGIARFKDILTPDVLALWDILSGFRVSLPSLGFQTIGS